ncbi:MAG: PilN domain-containing protein [Candidatus Roizmanbacteria bacterium]|nr:PilN domain-containing protein [Candidatus Roizmanbacteria bacterium]
MRYKINLLEKKDPGLLEKLTFFGLNYLRYIIVLTQLVVIGVFFYRFQIDQRIIDLKDGVEQKKEIVKIVLPLINEAAKIDKKTTLISEGIENQKLFSDMMEYFIASFPETITLSDMEIEGESLKIVGDASNAQHLQAFYSFLKKENKFKIVNLQNIKKTTSGYNFVLFLDKFSNS